MADCGATGSAIDRAARVLGGGGSGFATILAGHASSTTTTLPAAPPEYLPQLSSSSSQVASSQVASQHGNLNEIPSAQQQMLVGTRIQHPTAAVQQQYHSSSRSMQQQQHFMPPQPHHMMMMQTMHQQQAMMGAMLQQQQQQQRTHIEQVQQTGVEGSAQPATIAELGQAWKEVTNEQETAKPASIEELSQAWLEANEDWQTVADELGDFYGLDGYGNPETYEYHNAPTNESSTKNWMEEGMRYFQNGDIANAIRAFEMELQMKTTDNVKAWRMLGQCHAEQDMDRDAILCLEQAVEVDPYSVDARLALGVSYVNELEYTKALEHLKAWVTHNPQLSNITSSVVDIYGTSDSPFDEVQHLLLSALNHTQDPQSLTDIYTALGVVYNVSRDYDAAIDSFQKATTLSPNNYQLWNKLGATLANHNQSEQALEQYRRALRLKPKYARAWLNKAISHANLQQYDDAAVCYLQTLTLNPSATHCWSYLRVALSCAKRDDIIPLVAERNLEELRTRYGLSLDSSGETFNDLYQS